jgi:hypothetical protein
VVEDLAGGIDLLTKLVDGVWHEAFVEPVEHVLAGKLRRFRFELVWQKIRGCLLPINLILTSILPKT